MKTKIKGLTVLVFTAMVFLLAHAQQQQQGPPQRKVGGDKLNDAPQEDYPLMSLEEQKAAMRRIEEVRRKRRNNKLREKTPPSEWIQMPYHGLLLDANLDIIERTPENISKIQESIFAAVRKSARADSLKKRGSELGGLFKDKRLKGQEQLVAREAALETLLAESDAATRARYEWRIRLLGTGPASGGRPVISAALAKRLRELQVVADTPAPPEVRSEYVETCRAQGVPIPPDWPDERWIRQGPLGLVFISKEYEAEVFAYKDPAVPGVCYALPRRQGDSIMLLGIICQSATTGYACFWDNKEADGTTPITGPDVRLDIDTIGNGRTLGENCTMCHRGDNVFNIHPQTVLRLSRAGAPGGPYQTDSAIRYTPIGQPEWVNPPPLIMPAEPDDQGSCVTCHTLPQTAPPPGFPGRPYCASVLETAATLTMPPRGARAGWPGRDDAPVNPLYQAHLCTGQKENNSPELSAFRAALKVA